MHSDYRAWLKAQEYTDRSVSTQMSQVARIETEYGPNDALLEQVGYEALFTSFVYSAEDERRKRPNPSKFTAGKTDARVIGQTLGYMGDIAAEEDAPLVRGIIVAHDFDQRTRSAALAVPNLDLVRYAVSFTFSHEP